MTAQSVVIIGGGITGLTAAFYLKQAAKTSGVEIACTVLEATDRLGGKIDTLRRDGFVLERGPESMLARKSAGVQLIRDLGLESEMVSTQPQHQGTYVAHEGRLVPMPTGTNLGIPIQLSRFLGNNLLSAPGKARALADLLLPTGPAVPDESLGALLRRRFGDELVNLLCEPLLAGIYAGGIDDLSAEATFPQFRALERDFGSLIRGARHAAKRARASQQQVAHDGAGHPAKRSVFVTLAGGLSTLIERLYDSLHDWANLRLGTEVTSLTPTTAGYQLTAICNGAAETLHADAVIVTTPANVASRLLRTLPNSPPTFDVAHVSTATVMLGYQSEDVGDVISGAGFVVPRTEDLPITACTYLSNKWSHVAPQGYTVIRCYVGRSGQAQALTHSDDDLVNMARKAMQQLVGLAQAPAFAHVTRWHESMPQYAVGHLQRLEAVETHLRQTAPGVLLAGGGYRGVGIPDCIAQATAAVASVMERLNPNVNERSLGHGDDASQ